ncbi:hypothetical protein BJY21_003161 [Kineosphaera limosa]|uniref:hypothetical protein n=1 Tax=Kineosphaera limosa TaxID=111564 RepID=UPI0015C96C77|nr:hypothetical protein [Kineosphaera limosa]NYE01977.1 hypothetical protein [Kineosphaera limosa]
MTTFSTASAATIAPAPAVALVPASAVPASAVAGDVPVAVQTGLRRTPRYSVEVPSAVEAGLRRTPRYSVEVPSAMEAGLRRKPRYSVDLIALRAPTAADAAQSRLDPATAVGLLLGATVTTGSAVPIHAASLAAAN